MSKPSKLFTATIGQVYKRGVVIGRKDQDDYPSESSYADRIIFQHYTKFNDELIDDIVDNIVNFYTYTIMQAPCPTCMYVDTDNDNRVYVDLQIMYDGVSRRTVDRLYPDVIETVIDRTDFDTTVKFIGGLDFSLSDVTGSRWEQYYFNVLEYDFYIYPEYFDAPKSKMNIMRIEKSFKRKIAQMNTERGDDSVTFMPAGNGFIFMDTDAVKHALNKSESNVLFQEVYDRKIMKRIK